MIITMIVMVNIFKAPVWASFLIVVVRVMLECGMRVTAEHIDVSFDSAACGVSISTLVAFFFYVLFVT